MSAHAQYSAFYQFLNSETSKKRDFRQSFTNSENKRAFTAQVIDSLWREGYFSATAFPERSDTVQIHIGNKFNEVKLLGGEVPAPWLPNGFFTLNDQWLDPASFAEVANTILLKASNNGYPFAQISIDVIENTGDKLVARLDLSKSYKFYFYAIELPPQVNISKTYLERYLGLNSGSVYSQKTVSEIRERLGSVAFLGIEDEPALTFTDDGRVRIWLDLRENKVSTFDGILGIAPRSSPNERTLLTGELDFRLRNPFGRGISFDLAFEKFGERGQTFETDLNYPFLFGTAMGIETGLSLTRFDTLFVSLETKLGISYMFSGRSSITALYEGNNSYPISESTEAQSFEFLRSNSYGLKLEYNKVDFIQNPSRGWVLDFQSLAGVKNTNEQRNLLSKTLLNLTSYKSLSKRFVLMSQIQGRWLYDTTYAQNQARWIGGLRTIRGYNESEIPAKDFLILGQELRFLTDKSSHAKIFVDYALVNENDRLPIRNLWGSGLGFSFQTGPGIFTINYAVGFSKGNSFALSNGRVHFGFISYF